MADINNVINELYEQLKACDLDCLDCDNARFDFCYPVKRGTAEEALELLKKQKEHEELLTKLGYHWTGSGETLALCKRSKDGEQE